MTTPVPLTAQDILDHPRFRAARQAHVEALIGLFAGDRFVAEMMMDACTITLRGLIVGCHAAHDDQDRSSWGTVSRLQMMIAERRLASPRRVYDLISRFRAAGYVTVAPLPHDRRTRVLKPTERLLAHDRDHLAAYHRFLLDLYPGRGYEWTRAPDLRVQLAMRRTGFRALPQAMAFMRHSPFMMFLARDAGYLAFLLAAGAELQADDTEATFTSFAAHLGVSRTHIRNLFAEAEAAGYVRLGRDLGRPVQIMPVLWDAYDRFLADVQADQDAIAQSAFAVLRRDQPSGGVASSPSG
ncbi:hypothetical protein [Methylobacterium sp. A54F]